MYHCERSPNIYHQVAVQRSVRTNTELADGQFRVQNQRFCSCSPGGDDGPERVEDLRRGQPDFWIEDEQLPDEERGTLGNAVVTEGRTQQNGLSTGSGHQGEGEGHRTKI